MGYAKYGHCWMVIYSRQGGFTTKDCDTEFVDGVFVYMDFTTLYNLAFFRRISSKFLCSSKLVPHSEACCNIKYTESYFPRVLNSTTF